MVFVNVILQLLSLQLLSFLRFKWFIEFMKNLEPKIFRQRLIIEGHYKKAEVDGETVREYLSFLSEVLKMRIFSGPFSWPPDKWTNPEVPLHELNGFVAWTESG